MERLNKNNQNYQEWLNSLKDKLISYKKDLDRRNGKKTKEEMPSYNYDEQNLDGEIWKEYPFDKTLLVSSYGRIKVNGKIEQQKDLGGEYLVLERAEELHKIDRYIYRIVAETFLGKETNDGYIVHHITNNGLDCSINNLVLLTREEHCFVHSKLDN